MNWSPLIINSVNALLTFNFRTFIALSSDILQWKHLMVSLTPSFLIYMYIFIHLYNPPNRTSMRYVAYIHFVRWISIEKRNTMLWYGLSGLYLILLQFTAAFFISCSGISPLKSCSEIYVAYCRMDFHYIRARLPDNLCTYISTQYHAIVKFHDTFCIYDYVATTTILRHLTLVTTKSYSEWVGSY